MGRSKELERNVVPCHRGLPVTDELKKAIDKEVEDTLAGMPPEQITPTTREELTEMYLDHALATMGVEDEDQEEVEVDWGDML